MMPWIMVVINVVCFAVGYHIGTVDTMKEIKRSRGEDI